MRGLVATALVASVALLWVGSVRPQEGSDKARMIVQKAIEASGGAKSLGKLKTSSWKEKGIYYGMKKPVPYMAKYAAVWPKKFRMEIKGLYTMVVSGDTGWNKIGDKVKKMSKKEVKVHKINTRAGWISTLAPLKSKKFNLSLIGDKKVGDTPVVGVKVTRKNYPEVELYFNKKNHQLVKTVYATMLPERDFKKVRMVTLYEDWKKENGVMVPSKMEMKADGELLLKAEILEMKPEKKLPDDLFGKPEE